jgi:hypothetical protein
LQRTIVWFDFLQKQHIVTSHPRTCSLVIWTWSASLSYESDSNTTPWKYASQPYDLWYASPWDPSLPV